MADKMRLPEDLIDIERALKSLSPRSSRLDRDRLMYLAGQAAAPCQRPAFGSRGGHPVWPAIALTMTVAASLLGMTLLWQPVPKPVERIVYVDRAETLATVPTPIARAGRPTPRVTPVSPNYLTIRRLAIEEGVDAIPAAPVIDDVSPVRRSTSREAFWDILHNELGQPLAPVRRSPLLRWPFGNSGEVNS